MIPKINFGKYPESGVFHISGNIRKISRTYSGKYSRKYPENIQKLEFFRKYPETGENINKTRNEIQGAQYQSFIPK